MEAVIKVSVFEFDEKLFAKIKSLLQTSSATELTISITTGTKNILEEGPAEYWKGVEQAVEDVRNGKGTVFTMQEFEEYVSKNFSE